MAVRAAPLPLTPHTIRFPPAPQSVQQLQRFVHTTFLSWNAMATLPVGASVDDAKMAAGHDYLQWKEFYVGRHREAGKTVVITI